MVKHRRCPVWALSTALCVAVLVATAEGGHLAVEVQDSQPPPSPPVPPPKEKTPSRSGEGSDGSTSTSPSGGAGPGTQTSTHDPSSTNHTQLNPSPPYIPRQDRPPQPSPPLPRNTPGKLPLSPKDPPTTPAPPRLSSPPPSVPDPPVLPSASPPPIGKQMQPLPGHRTEVPPGGDVGRDENENGGAKKGDDRARWIPVEYEKVDKCTGPYFKCTFPLEGCTMPSGNDHEGLLIYVRNTGERSMNVTVLIPPSTNICVQGLPKNGTGQIPVFIDAKDTPKIIIKTGEEICTPLSKDAPTGTLFKQFQFYIARMTPIYGAYALFLTVLIAAGSWACCSFARRRRRRDAGVPYQQLEMGEIQSRPTVVADSALDNTADGWEQGWDDDWDDEETVVSRPQDTRNQSANNLTSRSAKKNGWED